MYWNIATVTRALEQVHACRPTVLQEFKRLVDDYTGQGRSLEYYDLVAGDWLEQFIHLTYVAWRRVTGPEGPPGGEFVVPAIGNPLEFQRASLADPDFHRFLDTAVGALLAGASPSTWRFSQPATEVCTPESGTRWGKRLAQAIGDRNAPVLICSPHYRCTPFQWVGALWRLRRLARWDDLNESIRVPARFDAAWRRRQAASAGPALDLAGLLRAMLPLLVPMAFLECFEELRRAGHALPLARPRAVYAGQSLNGHLVARFLLAEWRREGTRLLNHQHGGGYGLDRIHTPEEFECRVADRFYSWGWTNDNPRVTPMSSTPPPLDGVVAQGSRVALCCVDFPRFEYRLHFHPMPGSIQTMHEETVGFIRAFADRQGLVVRPYPYDYGWGFSDRLRREAAGATIDASGRRPFGLYVASRLVVHNYLGTAWLETLAMGVPTVCFYDPCMYAFRPAARPYIEELERVGILHHNGRDAAHFVNGLGKDVPGWWRRADVQRARNTFVETYANFSPDWPTQWKREFESQIEAAC